MEREYKKECETQKESLIEKIKIGIIGIDNQVGTSFIATSIAHTIANTEDRKVAYLEFPDNNGLLYESIGIEKRFKKKKYINVFTEIENNRYIRHIKNIHDNINWCLVTSEEKNRNLVLSEINQLKIINNVRGDTIICDFGSNFDSLKLDEMDIIICVIDPLPSKLISSKKLIERLNSDNYRKIVWVLNKNNSGVSNRLLRNYINLKENYKIPLINEEYFYIAEYNCRIPIEQKEIKALVADVIKDIIKNNIFF